MKTVLITGAAGRLGSALARGLASLGYDLRLTDIRTPETAVPGTEFVLTDLTDPANVARVMQGAEAVFHMAGHPNSSDWAVVNKLNIDVTRYVLDAAAEAGTARVVTASSNHVVGINPPDIRLTEEMLPRPDGPYGISKVIGEVLLEHYALRFGINGFAWRIGACWPAPNNTRELRFWLSHDDLVRLGHACLTTDARGYRAIWAMSNNTRLNADCPSWAAIGYAPQDDAEDHVDALRAKGCDTDIVSEWPYMGGRFMPADYPPDPLHRG